MEMRPYSNCPSQQSCTDNSSPNLLDDNSENTTTTTIVSSGMRAPRAASSLPTESVAAVGSGGGDGSGGDGDGGASATPTTSDRSSRKKQGTTCTVFGREGGGGVSPLIVFDWDDTMLTSSWIQSRDLLQAGTYEDLPMDARRSLAHLEQSAIKCLTNARGLGTVIIITNAESGWVELSASKFFLNLLPLLEGVPVVSARSLFEAQFPGSPLCWKAAAFAFMMHDHFENLPRWTPKIVVSIGDSNEEKVAMRIGSGQHSSMTAKAVKFMTGPDPEALAAQLDIVTASLASILAREGDAELILSPAMINESDCHVPLLPERHQQQHLYQQHFSSSGAGAGISVQDSTEKFISYNDRSNNDSAASYKAPTHTVHPSLSCTTAIATATTTSTAISSTATASTSAASLDAGASSSSFCSSSSLSSSSSNSSLSSLQGARRSSYPIPILGQSVNAMGSRSGLTGTRDDGMAMVMSIDSGGRGRRDTSESFDSTGSGGGTSAPSPRSGCSIACSTRGTAAAATIYTPAEQEWEREDGGAVKQVGRGQREEEEEDEEEEDEEEEDEEEAITSSSSPFSRGSLLSSSSPSVFAPRHPSTPKRGVHVGGGGGSNGGGGGSGDYDVENGGNSGGRRAGGGSGSGGAEADRGSPGGAGGVGLMPLGATMASGRGAAGEREREATVGGSMGLWRCMQ